MSSTPNKALKLFGRNVAKYRKDKGFSQEELAEVTDLDRTYISGIERAVRNPSLKNMAKNAEALKVDLDLLLK